MPQMSPMLWLMMMMIFFLSLILMISIMYFNKMKIEMTKITAIKNSMIWQW
nr:ATP synthase F0 subunit 8 [Tartessus sp.]